MTNTKSRHQDRTRTREETRRKRRINRIQKKKKKRKKRSRNDKTNTHAAYAQKRKKSPQGRKRANKSKHQTQRPAETKKRGTKPSAPFAIFSSLSLSFLFLSSWVFFFSLGGAALYFFFLAFWRQGRLGAETPSAWRGCIFTPRCVVLFRFRGRTCKTVYNKYLAMYMSVCIYVYIYRYTWRYRHGISKDRCGGDAGGASEGGTAAEERAHGGWALAKRRGAKRLAGVGEGARHVMGWSQVMCDENSEPDSERRDMGGGFGIYNIYICMCICIGSTA